MDGWMDGWINGWMDRLMNKWMVNEWQKEKWVDRWMNGWNWINGLMDWFKYNNIIMYANL